MDLKEIFTELWPWLLIALTTWGAVNDRKKKKRELEEARAERTQIRHRPPMASAPQPSVSHVAPPPVPVQTHEPRTEDTPAAENYRFDADAEGAPAVGPSEAVRQADAEEREAAEKRARRRSALRRAIIWSEVLPPKFREI